MTNPGKRGLANKIFFFTTIIGIPFSLVLMLAQGKPSFTELPYYGPVSYVEKEVNGETVVDTVRYTINDFSFTDSDGNTFSRSDFEGKNILIFSVLYTTCPFNCAINSTMFDKIAYQEVINIKDLKDVVFLTQIKSTERDSVDLSGLDNIHNPDKTRWKWFTVDTNVVYDIDFEGGNPLKSNPTNLPGGAAADGIIILVDKEMYVRGFYEGHKDSEIRRLRDDLWVLNKKEKQNAKLKN
ncbi:MAG: SCO family protein [Flavobacteriales bacterium]